MDQLLIKNVGEEGKRKEKGRKKEGKKKNFQIYSESLTRFTKRKLNKKTTTSK